MQVKKGNAPWDREQRPARESESSAEAAEVSEVV